MFNYMLQQNIDKKQRDQVSQFITNILDAALKDNDLNIEKGILTGVFDTLKLGWASGLNNVSKYTFTDCKFSSFYGFSKREIEDQLIQKMFKIPNPTSTEELLNKLTEWYSGYFVRQIGGRYRQAYNPLAVVNYLRDCIAERKNIDGRLYYSDSGSDLLLKQLFFSEKQKRGIEKILKFDLTHKLEIKIDPIDRISELDFSKDVDKYIELILINQGYVTCYKQYVFLKGLIPNKETFKKFRSVFKEWAREKQFIKDFSHINLVEGEATKEKMLNNFNQVKNSFVLGDKKVFKSLFVIQYQLSKDQSHFLSIEPPSSSGYIDNIFYPIEDLSDTVIIHEYNYNNKNAMKTHYGRFMRKITLVFCFLSLKPKSISKRSPQGRLQFYPLITLQSFI